MKTLRIAWGVVVRTLTFVALMALLAYCGIGKAHAQAPSWSCSSAANCNQQQAYDQCLLHATYNGTVYGTTNGAPFCERSVPLSSKMYSCQRYVTPTATTGCSPASLFAFHDCPAGQPWDDVVKKCKAPCISGAQQSGSCNSSKSGQCTTWCDNYCVNTFTHTNPDADWNVTEGPDLGYWKQGTWTETGASCAISDQPDEPPSPCPAGQKKLTDGTCGVQGDCPVGMHEIPPLGACSPDGSCPTGQQKAPDGSCVAESCPPGFAKKKNGTCGLDENDDGVPDEEDPGNEDGNKASGGESCENPPVCSGDPVMCLQTKIQWRIDCNTRKNATITGGACTNPPVCSGDGCKATEYASLMMQWRTACAVEKAQSGGGGGTDMSGVHSRLDRIGNFLDGNGQGTPEAPEMPFDESEFEGEDWSSGLPTGGTCPPPYSTTVSFQGISAPIAFEFTGICEFSVKLKTLVVMLGYLAGLWIIIGGRK